jgi:hypothetical protein
VSPQLRGLGERIRQEYLQKSYEAGNIIFAKGNSRYPFVAGSMGLDRNPTISDQRIPL